MNTDCFACTGKGCGVLTECICNNKTCHFYKTKEEHLKGRQKTVERLSTFPKEAVLYIKGKYRILNKDLPI